MFTKTAFAALGAAALILPAAASAQQYYGDRDQPNYSQSYGQNRGDYGRSQARGYPEFRGIEEHIRREILEGMQDGSIERDDAHDLFGQLRDIQSHEAREFRVHRWNLPDDDRYRLRSQLQQLDQLVDRIRAEPG